MTTGLSGLMSGVLDVMSMMRNECIIFFVAIAIHGLVFSSHRAGGVRNKAGRKEVPDLAQKSRQQESPKARACNPQRKHFASQPPHPTECERYALQRQQEREEQVGHIHALKALQRGALRSAVDRTLNAAMNFDGSDEALLTAIVDATIRMGRTDLFAAWAQKQQSVFQNVKRAHTFSSVIRMYGAMRDLNKVWSTWSNMRKSHITPTCVTMGCMVEALVANGDPDSAYDLIQEIRSEENGVKSVVNSVIYGTVLKGFAHQKKFNRVWSVYQEMLAVETDFTIVTFNTVIDACSRCEELHRIPTLLSDMDRLMIRPNIITYGAILKGYCQEGNLDKAYNLMKTMKESTEFRPDEIMFNSLLDGCARLGQWDRAKSVLKEMDEADIKPTNFTLSVLVKVGRRSTCKLDSIFAVCRQISQDVGFSLNVHVYTNLIHACVDRKDCSTAMGTLGEMLRKRVRPDARTYTVLLKGLLQAGDRKCADGVLRAALGLRSAHPDLLSAADDSVARLRPESPLPRPFVSEVVDGIVGSCGRSDEDLAARLLQDATQLGIRVDSRIKMRFAARVAKS